MIPPRLVIAMLCLLFVGVVQGQTVQTSQGAYAIVTPESGNPAGLLAVETLSLQTLAGRIEAQISPAAVLTSVAFPVNLGTISNGTTGIAIVNPTASAGNVHLSVTDPQGIEILRQTVSILPRGQLSRFLNEIFAGQISSVTTLMGLLAVTSDVPVAVLAMDFHDAAFAPLPAASLGTALPLTTSSTSSGSTVETTTTTGTAPVAFPTVSVMPSFGSFATTVTSPVATATTTTTTTVIGSTAFKTRAEAEGSIKTTKVCTSD